ncbi:MAG TPA: SUMF1/EgtB/PvdO family nonheme iron enzyme [Planctomycetota bacterium]|nr:SUMF1/EgtB/PvdO family nonheme iron enzyme [Planctomycetota bacterium]
MAEILFALLTLSVPAALQAPKSPPPGMVLVPGGITSIGTERAEVEKAAEENAQRFLTMANETPQFERNVDAFYLGVTEVTNEQFAVFVKATGARPPDSWGMKAIDEASRQHAMDVGTKRNAARDAGKPIPKFPEFDQAQWWNDHWQSSAWEIPKDQETLPVGYIDFNEAESYARWAGVRLMTEFEFQRAARGNSKHTYPWGDKWDPALCANGGQGLKAAKPVGSYPGGQSAQGVFDLSGNVWEWTSSPFVEYPGFKVLKVKRKGDTTIEGLVDWNAGRRVVVGGSYVNESSAARIATRRPTEPNQSAEATGFRIAASTTPGMDVASAVLRAGTARWPADLKYDESKTVIADHWWTQDGKSQVPGSAVIGDYQYVAFVPAIGLEFTSLGQLELASLDRGPVPLGIVATTRALEVPKLPAGSYSVALRGPGPLSAKESLRTSAEAPAKEKQGVRMQDPKAKAPLESFVYPHGFKPEQRNLLFYDKDRSIVAAVHVTEAEFAVPGKTGVDITETTVNLRVNSWVKVSNKALVFTIPLEFAKGDVTADWRH